MRKSVFLSFCCGLALGFSSLSVLCEHRKESAACAQLLRLAHPSERQRMQEKALEGRQIVRDLQLDRLWLHLEMMEEAYDPVVVVHMLQLFPYVLTQFSDQPELVLRWSNLIQRYEMTFLQESLRHQYGGHSEEPSIEILEEFERLVQNFNFLRVGAADEDELVGPILEALRSANFRLEGDPRQRTYAEYLGAAYVGYREQLFFEEPIQAPTSGDSLADLIAADLKRVHLRDYAIFFLNLVFVQIELTTDFGREDYSPLGPAIVRPHLSEDESPVENETVSWIRSMNFLFTEAEYEEIVGTRDLEREDDLGLEEEAEIDYARIAGVSESALGEDGHEELVTVNSLHALLQELYQADSRDEEMAAQDFDLVGWMTTNELSIQDWIRPYALFDGDLESPLYLTPLQFFVQLENGPAIEAIQQKLAGESMPPVIMLPPQPLIRLIP